MSDFASRTLRVVNKRVNRLAFVYFAGYAVVVSVPVVFLKTARQVVLFDCVAPLLTLLALWLLIVYSNLISPRIGGFDYFSTYERVRDARLAPGRPLAQGGEPRVPRRREHDFIAWAAEHGAQVGGATGAGGDSPKLLLRTDPDGQVWIDVWQDEPENPASHVLVKFARTRHERDRLILRSEYVYYQALERLGIATISTEGMELHEGQNGPSLWLPRFDVRRREGREVRLGVESMYSLLAASPGARLRHQDVLAALRRVVPAPIWPRLLLDYVERDVLNLVFGNSDNHGRNTSLLKSAAAVWLAPVYDFAPMKMDLEGITRTTHWGPFERGGEVDWRGLLPTFGEHEPLVRDGLRALAERLTGLPALLRELGLPEETLEFPGLGLLRTEERLREWGLL